MADQYTGDRTTAQLPGSVPNEGVSPIGVLPTDGDDLNASSVLQAFKELLDFVDYCTHRFQMFPGVREYEASRTYAAGMMCLSTDGMTYRVKTGQTSTGVLPQSDTAKWERWGYSSTELAAAFPFGTSGTGQVTLPGGFQAKWATLVSNDLPTEGTSKDYSFYNPFANACLAVWFQPSAYSGATNAGIPQVSASGLTAAKCTLTSPNSPAECQVSGGFLLAIGY